MDAARVYSPVLPTSVSRTFRTLLIEHRTVRDPIEDHFVWDSQYHFPVAGKGSLSSARCVRICGKRSARGSFGLGISSHRRVLSQNSSEYHVRLSCMPTNNCSPKL